VSIKDAALMVRRIVDANMGQAIRRETVLKGFDPREFILFAFGGAGPTHCCGYARFAEMEKIVVFPFAPTFCAFGSSTMDVVHVYERSHHLHLLHPATGMYMEDFESFNETVRGLREVALRDFAGEGYDPAEVTYELELDMKFGGQLNVKRVSSPLLELSTDADAVALRHAFEREYGDAYSPLGLNPEAGIEIHNFVLRGRVAQRRPELERHEFVSEDPSPALVSTREAHWEDLGTVATPVYSQELIRCGNAIDGPAIIEAEDTTVVIEPGFRYTLDTYLNGVMERRHSSADARPMAALAQATPD
jgi:N-methylhydantoinase A/acetophenone carboxylase